MMDTRFLARLFALLMALQSFLIAPMASAQTFQVPTDISAFSGSSGWGGFRTPTYKTDGTANLTIDPTVTAMPIGNGMTSIPTTDTTGMIRTTAARSDTDPSYLLTTIHGGTGGEAKMRSQVDISDVLGDDPIRNPRQPGGTHAHMFFGGKGCNAYSTYKTVRQHARQSFAAGIALNGSCYWAPLMEVLNPYGNGKNYGLLADVATIYYTGTPADMERADHLPAGKREVFGFEMDAQDPNVADNSLHPNGQYAWMLPSINTANTGSSSTRYSLVDPNGVMFSSARYICSAATVVAPHRWTDSTTAKYLSGPHGEDPWNGTCQYASFTGSTSGTTLTVSPTGFTGQIRVGQTLAGAGILDSTTISAFGTGTGGPGTYVISKGQTVASEAMEGKQDLFIRIDGNPCYNGYDLWSPGGYKHQVPKIYDIVAGGAVCPTNYWWNPPLTVELHYTQYGPADYLRWVLSSDLAYRASHGLTQVEVPAGWTFHTDRLDGWDRTTQFKWENNCAGVRHQTSHQCNVSVISPTEQLIGGDQNDAGIYRARQVDVSSLSHKNEGDPGWVPIPASMDSNMTHHKLSANDNMPRFANDNVVLAGAAPIAFDLRQLGR
jgi:hypothetical protein